MFSLSAFFENQHDAIIEEWVDRLKTEVGEQYAGRPRPELMQTVTEAYEANVRAIIRDDYLPIDTFIDKITEMRLEAGFLLSDVQKAFELFRRIVVPMLAGATRIEDFSAAILRINRCLDYTIHRFSDHFQAMHEKEILEHNRRLEEEVKERTAEIKESERMAYIGQITTSLSHEIRNPLSAVKMNLQILKKNPKIRGNDQRRIDISVSAVNRLEGILEELLDFAKPLQLKRGMARINEILSTAVDLLEMKFREQKMVLLTDFDPRIPDIQADREKLGQAFINILLNALEASPAGSIIEIGSMLKTATGGIVQVIIADEGLGVAGEQAAEIFKPFFTTKSKGTGLGLSNARRIIDAHGGWITVENRHPCGALFKVTLPAPVRFEAQ